MGSREAANQVVFPALCSLLLVLGLLGNRLVLAVLCRLRKEWSMTDTFILHLAIADILLLLTLPFSAVDAAKGWVFGTLLCKVSGALFQVGVGLPASREHWRRKQAECFYHYPTNHYGAVDLHLVSTLLQLGIGFLIPSVIMVFCCSSILLQLLCRRSQGLRRRVAVRVILALAMAHILCWMPFKINQIVEMIPSLHTSEGHIALGIYMIVAITLGLIRCCLNPVLYAVVAVKFRRHLLDMLKSLSCGHSG
ncbi:hypothetical protein JZ751_000042, partial [Albula glossodonta]